MPIRLKIAQFQMRLGRFIESLALMLLTPDDLLELNRLRYSRPGSIDFWNDQETVARGLYPEEQELLAGVPQKSGRALVIGVGGGREAIPLAQTGFAVTGLDFIPEMVARAQENALRHGIKLAGLVQEISRLDVPANSFDLAIWSSQMYSSVPTRRRRLQMLARINRGLKPGGYLICCYNYNENLQIMPRYEFIKRLVAAVTAGYRDYEPGDRLWISEFMHIFLSEDEFRTEVEAAGFEMQHSIVPKGAGWAWARLRKAAK